MLCKWLENEIYSSSLNLAIKTAIDTVTDTASLHYADMTKLTLLKRTDFQVVQKSVQLH
jgi:hypothetical protein